MKIGNPMGLQFLRRGLEEQVVDASGGVKCFLDQSIRPLTDDTDAPSLVYTLRDAKDGFVVATLEAREPGSLTESFKKQAY